MEKEENKKGCCEEIKTECCDSKEKCCNMVNNCSHNWKKCHMAKKVITIIIIIIAFCLGTQWGEMKGEWRGNRFQRGMMYNDYGRFESRAIDSQQKVVGEVTVDVSKNPQAPVVAPKQ